MLYVTVRFELTSTQKPDIHLITLAIYMWQQEPPVHGSGVSYHGTPDHWGTNWAYLGGGMLLRRVLLPMDGPPERGLIYISVVPSSVGALPTELQYMYHTFRETTKQRSGFEHRSESIHR